jgi:predicted small metal-binding protein
VDDGVITVRCACGWETIGAERDVIEAATEHGRRLHNMAPTRDEVLAMALDRSQAQDSPDEPPGPVER